MRTERGVQRSRKKGIVYYLLWLVGWIIFFPVPATILLVRSKKVPLIFKLILLFIIWILGFALVNSLSDSNGTKSTGSVSIENESQKEPIMTEANMQNTRANFVESHETDVDLETDLSLGETNSSEAEPMTQAPSERVDSDSKSLLSEIVGFGGSSSAPGEEESEMAIEVYCEDEGINDYIIKYNNRAAYPISKTSISENYYRVVSYNSYDNGDTTITFGHGMEDVSVALDCYGIDVEMVKQILYDILSVQDTQIAKADIDAALDEIRVNNKMSAYNLYDFNNIRCDITFSPLEEGKSRERWKITIM